MYWISSSHHHRKGIFLPCIIPWTRICECSVLVALELKYRKLQLLQQIMRPNIGLQVYLVLILQRHSWIRCFITMEKNFCLRGVQEHVNLKFSQLLQMTNPDRYIYFEHSSKNHFGGINDRSSGKIVEIVHLFRCLIITCLKCLSYSTGVYSNSTHGIFLSTCLKKPLRICSRTCERS